MKIIYLIFALLYSISSYSQKKGDSKIIITPADTADIYNRMRTAFAKADFVIKELNTQDSIATHPRELKTISGFAIANAIIKDGKVILNGFYTRRIISYYGVIKTSKDVKPITYFMSGKLWPMLMKVANDVGGEIQYSK